MSESNTPSPEVLAVPELFKRFENEPFIEEATWSWTDSPESNGVESLNSNCAGVIGSIAVPIGIMSEMTYD